MNITLSADSKTIERARAYAQRRGGSLNQLVRDFLKEVTAGEDRDRVAEEFARNALAHAGQSPEGFRFDRDAAHRRSV